MTEQQPAQFFEFIQGWIFGNAQGRELSAREIAVQFPEVENADVFAQGNVDGVRGDKFRLGLAQERVGAFLMAPTTFGLWRYDIETYRVFWYSDPHPFVLRKAWPQ